tara:strand:- start:488 stop:2083 length:1596 start_codon:yes stop_codon:yes gene_type:complete
MPNLDKIHYKFFPKSQTASTGSKLIYFAWAIEISVAIVGLSIAYLFYKTGGQTGLKIEDVANDAGADAVIVALSFFVVAIMELTKIPLATALYYSAKASFRLLFLFALLAVNVSTFETIIQGFELNYNNRSRAVIIEKAKLDEIKAQLKNLDENQDTSDLDKKIAGLNKQIEQYRNERVQISISKETEISQIQKQYTGDNANIKNLAQQRDYLNQEIIGLKNTLGELDKELAKTKDGFLVKQSTKIKVRILDYQSQLKAKEQQRDGINKEIRRLTSQASGTIDPLVETISKTKDEELKRNQELIDSIVEQKKVIEQAKAEKISDQTNVEKIRSELTQKRDKQEEIFKNQARENSLFRIAVKIKIAKALLNDEDIGDKIDEADLNQEDIDTAFWIWFGSLAFVISVIGTLVAFAGLHLKDERMHLLRNEPKNRFKNMLRAFTKVPVDASKYIRAATKRLLAPKIVKEKVEIEKVVEKIVEKPVIEEKIVYQKVEVPKEIIKKVYVHVPFPTDDQKILKKGPIIHNEDDEDKK